MAYIPFGVFPPHYHNDNGSLLNGGLISFYESGTENPLPVYTDHTGTVEASQPIELNTRGEPQTEGIYLPDNKVYKIIIKRPNGTTIKTIDGFTPINGIPGPQGATGPAGAIGATGATGPAGAVVYAEYQSPAFSAYCHDVVAWNRTGLSTPADPSPTYRSWFVPSYIFGLTSPYINDAQFSRDSRIFKATAAKRWLFTGTASYVGASAIPAGTEFAIVLKRAGTGAFFPARAVTVGATAGCSSVTAIIDLLVGDEVSFGCNSSSIFASYVFAGHQISIPISLGSGGESDGKSFTSINDTVSGFLLEKIEAGTNVTLVESDGPTGKKITISASEGDPVLHDDTSPSLVGSGVGFGHLNDLEQSIYGVKTFLSQTLFPAGWFATNTSQNARIYTSVAYGSCFLSVAGENADSTTVIADLYCSPQNKSTTLRFLIGSTQMLLTESYLSFLVSGVTYTYGLSGYSKGGTSFLFPTDESVAAHTLATRDWVTSIGYGGYNHTQSSASAVWTITHNLGYKPVVQSWNSADDVISGTIHHVSANQLTITFSTAQSGGARCA